MTANQSSDAFSRQRRLQPSDADDNADGLFLVSAMMDTPTGIPMGEWYSSGHDDENDDRSFD